MASSTRICFLSMDDIDPDMGCSDQLAVPYLVQQGIHVDTVSWRSHQDWKLFAMVVIRSTWDYQQRPQDFLDVLEGIQRKSTRLENPLGLIRWNMDKIYLQQLDKEGVAIVPTIWKDRLGNERLTYNDDIVQCMDHFQTDKIVLKPRVSASSENTFCVHRHKNDAGRESQRQQRDDEERQWNEAFSSRDFMIQPFVDKISKEGEYSLFYFSGKLSHAILKVPKQNDFRVQEEFGGRHTLVEEAPKELRWASERALEALEKVRIINGTKASSPPPPLYARLDMVRSDRDEESFLLMEMELIEPSLYLEYDPRAPERFAQAIHDRLVSQPSSAKYFD